MKLLHIFGEGSSRRSKKTPHTHGIRSIGTNTQDDARSGNYSNYNSNDDIAYHTDTEITLACDSRSLRSASSSSSLKKSLKQRFSFRSVSSSSQKEFTREKSRSLPPFTRKSSKQSDIKSIETLDVHPTGIDLDISLDCRDLDTSDCTSYISAKSSRASVEISESTLKDLQDTTFSSSSSTLEGEPLYLNGNIYANEQSRSTYLTTVEEILGDQWNLCRSVTSHDSTTPCSDDTLIGDSVHSVGSQGSPYPRPQAPTPPASEPATPLKSEKLNPFNRLIGSLGSSFRDDKNKTSKRYDTSQHSPGSSVQSGSGDSGVDTYETKGHFCASCKMSFRAREQLCDHWKALHEHESFIELKETLRRKGHASGMNKQSTSQDLWYNKATPDLPRHIFKAKKLKKGKLCHVCHQPVIKLGSCCRVCKYLVHKGCEPKNNNEANQPSKQLTISSRNNNNEANQPSKQLTISSRNTQSAARTQQRHQMGSDGPAQMGVGPAGAGTKMDLVYVTERIISLAFPLGMDDVEYTLHLREVAHMLSSKHSDSFRVFDLSPGGEVSRFLPRVSPLGWAHGLAPPLERLCTVCKALDSWLNQNPSHVAVLHSRSGYEKLGVVIAAYLHYSNICASTDQALDRYAMKRFFDDKIGELYHPSQKRYVQYFAGLLSGVIRINSSPLYLHTLTLYGVPHFEQRGGCHLFIKIYQGMTPVYTSGVYNLTDAMRQVTIAFETGVQLRGDILLKAYHRRLTPASREVIFRVQFHTCAVSDKVLPFARQQLDDACNDLRFPLDGGIELLFSHSPEDRPGIVSNVSCDKAPCAITSWDSYEQLAKRLQILEEQVASSAPVAHTLGPLDGSLYATVSKRRSNPNITTPHSPSAPSPSPQGANSRYAASIDSGIASSNSAGVPPISPPTSDTSRASGETGGTAPVSAHTPRPPTAAAGKSHVDARQLDELLAGMLLDIQSIPDLRPCQTPAPDIDSIRCPEFSSSTSKTTRSIGRKETYKTEIPPPKQYGGLSSPSLNLNGYDSSSTFFPSEDVPYHARTDSKPFSYGAVTSSPLLNRHRNTSDAGGGESGQPPPSPSIHRKNSKETLGTSRAGLESPRLIRKMSGNVGATPGDGYRHSSRSPSPDTGSRSGTLKRERAQTLTTRIMSGDASPSNTLGRSSLTRSASRLEDVADGTYSQDSFSRSYSSGSGGSSSWLQTQQRKLQERRDAKIRAERGPQEARMFSELRSRIMQHQHQGREFEDGYISDTTMFSETSRESSPIKTLPPLTINTSSTSPNKPPVISKGGSAPSSPILPQRGISSLTRQAHFSNTLKGTTSSRKASDGAHDRERPFVAVKRAHDVFRGTDTVDSNTALSHLQSSPLGHINYSLYNHHPYHTTTTQGQNDGLLTTIHTTNQDNPNPLEKLYACLSQMALPKTDPFHPHSSIINHNPSSSSSSSSSSCTAPNKLHQQGVEDPTWQSDSETLGTNRPITPAFPPATPTTPYLNQGLPPKSPTAARKALLGMSPKSTKPLLERTSSLPSKDIGGLRSPSPATNYLRQELNGHSSPAPSLYHGQSRRSSLTSLNDSIEVISSHPKFVKDISKYWYKPNISRDDAINMLRDKAPGTFVVRDSNSFPGAFGLALKVSTPPPNVTSKSSDPTSELVRHFLIEPTSRGVRLKGCANEPVFGSLSALVYQHSITALALPCRLVLPEKDPAGSQDSTDGTDSTKADTTQLLQQGAACNVLYLYTADTESLTGPQAVKRAIQVMHASKPIPIVVHFKVSSQGITLTDNSRQLFFRRHYPVNSISHCGLDPDDRRWTQKNEEGDPIGSLRMFGFVAKKGASRTDNQCHILAELEPEQPATAICNFVTKVMMTSINRSNLV